MTHQPKILKLTRLGNPVLRTKTKKLSASEIRSDKVQHLIADMKYTLEKEKYGVGLAAPQVGEALAISVIGIKPTPNRPDLKRFETVLINPEIVETYDRAPAWEGCVSVGTKNDLLFAQVPRYQKIRLKWTDENAISHDEMIDGFTAHVAQHEVDHLAGKMFVDSVEDTRSYMMGDEYRARVVENKTNPESAQK